MTVNATMQTAPTRTMIFTGTEKAPTVVPLTPATPSLYVRRSEIRRPLSRKPLGGQSFGREATATTDATSERRSMISLRSRYRPCATQRCLSPQTPTWEQTTYCRGR